MTLESTLRQQLNKLDSGSRTISLGDWTLRLTVEKNDSLSCALTELALEQAAPVGEEVDTWANRIAGSATGLLEALRLIELDRPVGKALLRSESPAKREGKAYYYELLLERSAGSRAVLHRYAGHFGAPRDSVPFVLTHDALVKLAGDIVGGN